MDPQRPSNSDTKSASLILKQLKEAAKAAEDVDDYYDTEEDEDEEDEDEEVEEEEEIVGRFGFRIESNDGKVTKKKKLASSGGSGKRGNTSGGGGGVAASRCQVEKCGADLSEAKRYYKRHKVCEAHAKSPLVVVDGIRQRFCQQCSRFHELSEFDEMRRSCRSRLAGHNERRRKLSSETHREDSSSRSQLKEIQRGQVDERGRITIAVPGKHIQIL